MQFENSIEINASAEKVFSVLCDFKLYAEWHPSVSQVLGQPNIDEWVRVFLKIGERVVPVSALITVCDQDQCLEWQGSLVRQGFLRSSFLVRHAFIIETISAEKVKFTNEEAFSWLLSPLVNLASNSFIRGYKEVNEALKLRCESL